MKKINKLLIFITLLLLPLLLSTGCNKKVGDYYIYENDTLEIIDFKSGGFQNDTYILENGVTIPALSKSLIIKKEDKK